MSEKEKPSLGYRVVKGILYAILLMILALVLLVLVAGSPYFLQIPYHLVCGWIFHAWKELPPFFAKWEAAILPLGCLLFASVLAHRFVRRWVADKKPSCDWKAKHTVAVMSLLLLFSAAAIATSGIFHQFFWLSSGKVIESNRRGELTVAINNARQLMLAIFEFQAEKGRYPNSLDELDDQAFNLQRLIWVKSSGVSAPEPFVFLKPGSTEIALEEEPLLVSPLMEEGRKAIVGYGDMSVRVVSAKYLEVLLEKARGGEDE